MDAVLTILSTPSGHREVPCRCGETLYAALVQAGEAVEAPCGGTGRCGKCAIRAEGALSPMTPEEQHLPPGWRLACRTRILGDCTVQLPDDAGTMDVLTDTAPAAFSAAQSGFGAAIDIGTTSVAVALFDRSNGRCMGVRGAPNCQRRWGADVVSRIHACMEEPANVTRMAEEIRRQLRTMLAEAACQAGIRPTELCAVTLAGNPTMCHLVAGLSPVPLGTLPFQPVSRFGADFNAAFLAALLGVSETAAIWILPSVSGFFGGDAVGAACAVGLGDAEQPTLLLDVGTNGEMALAASGRIVCCSAAAGPAFEGANITCGMAGMDGAVAHASLSDAGTLQLSVLGEAKPRGICGSGLIDLLAVMRRLDAVDETGRLLPPEEAPEAALPYLRLHHGEPAFFVAEEVYLTAADVRALQLAKAAVAAGIQTMLAEVGLTANDVAALVVAGGFGNRIDPVTAAQIGLYPPELADKTTAAGNAALAGAAIALGGTAAQASIMQLRDRMESLELSADPRFSEFYMENLSFDTL